MHTLDSKFRYMINITLPKWFHSSPGWDSERGGLCFHQGGHVLHLLQPRHHGPSTFNFINPNKTTGLLFNDKEGAENTGKSCQQLANVSKWRQKLTKTAKFDHLVELEASQLVGVLGPLSRCEGPLPNYLLFVNHPYLLHPASPDAPIFSTATSSVSKTSPLFPPQSFQQFHSLACCSKLWIAIIFPHISFFFSLSFPPLFNMLLLFSNCYSVASQSWTNFTEIEYFIVWSKGVNWAQKYVVIISTAEWCS